MKTVTIPAPLQIEAAIKEENFIQHVTLYIKKQGTEELEQYSMQHTGELYKAEIPTAELEAGTLEYYIETSDGFNILGYWRLSLPGRTWSR